MRRSIQLTLVTIVLSAMPVVGQESSTQPASKPAAPQGKIATLRDLKINDYAECKAAWQKAMAEVRTRRKVLQSDSGLVDPSDMHQLVVDLQSQREKLLQEEAAEAGRRSGIETAVKQASDEAERRAGDSLVLKEMRAVVATREAQLDRARQLQKAAAVSAAEVDQATADLAMAKAGLAAEQQRAVRGSTDAIDGWNRDLMNLNIANSERHARMGYIEARLKQFIQAQGDSERLEDAISNLAGRKSELDQARLRLPAGDPRTHEDLVE